MDSSASVETHHDPHSHAGEHEHHELGLVAKIHFLHRPQSDRDSVRSLRLAFLFFGFCLMMLMRWQLAYPGQALPVIGKFLPHIFGPGSMPDGKMTPDFYNSLGAMHGTIMIFLGVVPLAFAAFGNFVVPLQIGAPDMTFPKVNTGEFLGVFCWRRDHADQFLRSRRRGQKWLDFLYAAGGQLRIPARDMIRCSTARLFG